MQYSGINILWDKGLTKGVCPDSLRLVFKLGVLMLKLTKQRATRAWSIVCVLFIVSTLLILIPSKYLLKLNGLRCFSDL